MGKKQPADDKCPWWLPDTNADVVVWSVVAAAAFMALLVLAAVL